MCEHTNWEVLSWNRIGTGFCHDCKEEIAITTLLNNLKKRMEDAIVKASK